MMSTSLTARNIVNHTASKDSRYRGVMRRLATFIALTSALAFGFAALSTSQPAQAATNLDGQWTIVHGGTGQVSLNADGTYTSTCQITVGYADAWCPAPSGTFERNTLGSSIVNFHGTDGSTASYHFSGNVYSPDTITSTFASPTYSPLVMKKGTAFVCTNWGDNGYRMKGSPLVYLDGTGTILYATGSHQLLGPATADNQVSLAETAPNYFQSGSCGHISLPSATHHVGDLDNSSTLAARSKWLPKVTVTVLDSNGAAVAGATVSATFSHHAQSVSCTTTANGTCTLGNFSFNRLTPSTVVTITGVVKASSTYTPTANSDPDGDSNGTTITLNRP